MSEARFLSFCSKWVMCGDSHDFCQGPIISPVGLFGGCSQLACCTASRSADRPPYLCIRTSFFDVIRDSGVPFRLCTTATPPRRDPMLGNIFCFPPHPPIFLSNTNNQHVNAGCST